jgi:hypothetical protein
MEHDMDYTHNLMPPRRERRVPMLGIVLIGAALFWFCLGAWAVFAQSSESSAGSESSANVEVLTGAAAGAAINNYGQKAGKDNRVYGEVATAPSLGGLALGGGHPCAYSPATAQISIIGGGAGIGGSKVDSACMLMVMGAAGDKKAYTAAQLMIAARDPAACRAMETAGLVSGCPERRGLVGNRPDRSKPAPEDVADGTNTGTGARCELAGKVLTFRPTSKAARVAELAACRAKFGV